MDKRIDDVQVMEEFEEIKKIIQDKFEGIEVYFVQQPLKKDFMEINECLKNVNDQKAVIEKIKEDKNLFDKSLLGKTHALIANMDWVEALKKEEKKLSLFRIKLCEARGE